MNNNTEKTENVKEFSTKEEIIIYRKLKSPKTIVISTNKTMIII